MDKINKEDLKDINKLCGLLNNQNKKYVIAVANALKFTQDTDKKPQRTA